MAPLPAHGVSSAPWDRLLRAHVDAAGRVDYNAFARSPEFERYLRTLASAELDPLSEPERLALWINAYNAYTIQLINKHAERRSIRNINKALGFVRGKGPWSEQIARVAGHTYTLDQVEHEIVRKRFTEPRIHFALVCAAEGCPPLRREAYTAARLDAQLDDQARRFLLNSPAKNRVDAAGKRVYLSPIFKWYAEDFGGSEQGVGRYLARFHPQGAARALLERGGFAVEYTPYDWSLNVQR